MSLRRGIMNFVRTLNMTDQDCLAFAVLDDISRTLKSAIDAKAGVVGLRLNSSVSVTDMQAPAHLRLGNRMRRDCRLRLCSLSTSWNHLCNYRLETPDHRLPTPCRRPGPNRTIRHSRCRLELTARWHRGNFGRARKLLGRVM